MVFGQICREILLRRARAIATQEDVGCHDSRQRRHTQRHSFAAWCKRIALICDAHNSAAAQTSAAASGAATEHAKQDTRFRKVAEQVVEQEFTSQQKQEPDYQIISDKSIASPLRSTIGGILRKNLGDVRVMDYIFDHHIPKLLDPLLHVEEHRLHQMLDDL